MPGITERQFRKGGSGLRNFEFMVWGADTAASRQFIFTAADASALSTGAQTLAEDKVPVARQLSFYLATAAGGSDRTIVATIHGLNQFGDVVSETITFSAVAGSATTSQLTANIYQKVRALTLDTLTNTGADELSVGVLVDQAANTDPEDIYYGIPVKIRDVDDLLGGIILEATTWGLVAEDDLTVDTDIMGVKFAAGVAPDGGDDRFLVIKGHTSW